MSASVTERPTLEDVKNWPAVVDVTMAALALGVSRSSLYEALRTGNCPVEHIRVGHRVKVITAGLVRVLEGTAGIP